MEHDIPFGNSNRENGTTFLDFPLFLGIFQWDESTKGVPFTAEPEIPEILTKWKAPSKKVGPFSRLEFPNGISCSIYVSRSLYQFQVHGRVPPRTGVYDQIEQLFTNRKFHFRYHRNFRVFFLNGKRPLSRMY